MNINRREFVTTTAGAIAAVSTLSSTARAEKLTHHRTKFAVNLEMIKFRTQSFLERMERAAEFGFPGVEFWPHKGKDIPAIAKKKDELKLAVAQFTASGWESAPVDAKNHDRFVAAVTEACQVAHQLDCRLLTVVSGQEAKGLSRDEQTKNLIEGLKRAGEVAAKEKITLILEPLNIKIDHKGHFLSESAHAAQVIKAVDNPNVRILWDIYHQEITDGNVINTIKQYYPLIGYFQIADNPGRHEPGTGEINYNNVLKAVYELGYRGFIGMEFSPAKDDEAALRATVNADVW